MEVRGGGNLVKLLADFDYYVFLWLQLAISKRGEESASNLFELDGVAALGSFLQILPCSDRAPQLSECSVQWYRLTSEGGKRDIISGI